MPRTALACVSRGFLEPGHCCEGAEGTEVVGAAFIADDQATVAEQPARRPTAQRWRPSFPLESLPLRAMRGPMPRPTDGITAVATQGSVRCERRRHRPVWFGTGSVQPVLHDGGGLVDARARSGFPSCVRRGSTRARSGRTPGRRAGAGSRSASRGTRSIVADVRVEVVPWCRDVITDRSSVANVDARKPTQPTPCPCRSGSECDRRSLWP